MKHFARITTKNPLQNEMIAFALERLGAISYMERPACVYIFYLRSSPDPVARDRFVQDWFTTGVESFVEFSVTKEIIPRGEKMMMLDELSRFIHSERVREKINSGWRFGQEFSAEKKTSPLLLPWEQLPQEYKKLQPGIFTKVLEILSKSVKP